jgi:hypothetical protein
MRRSGRGLCRSDADGVALSDPDPDSKDGYFRIRLDDQWIKVPDDTVNLSAAPHQRNLSAFSNWRLVIFEQPSKCRGLAFSLLTGVPTSLPGAGNRCAMPSRGLLPSVPAGHRLGAFPLPIAFRAVVFRGARFLHGDRYGLPSALNFAALAAATAAQLAVLEFVHHPAGDALLPG